MAEAVKRACCRVGVDTAEYSGHSMRAGLVTSAAAAGVAELDIARTSRHKSVPTLRTYVREAQLFSATQPQRCCDLTDGQRQRHAGFGGQLGDGLVGLRRERLPRAWAREALPPDRHGGYVPLDTARRQRGGARGRGHAHRDERGQGLALGRVGLPAQLHSLAAQGLGVGQLEHGGGGVLPVLVYPCARASSAR